MRILIAEDDLVSRRMLAYTLKKFGHETISAQDGTIAYEEYQKEHPDVIISDWVMPGMSGLDLCRLIRTDARKRYPYVILLTALSSKRHYLEGMQAGADDFVRKPFDEDELDARLQVAERILTLHADIAQLSGMLPICASCKNIRDDKGY